MSGIYDLRLVALSVGIAIFSSYAALDLAARVTASRRSARAFWLFGGACAMGFGIWSMHYIGMLAFKMPIDVLYDVPTVLLSLLAAIAASAVALFTVSRPRMGLWQTATGGVVMGSGIAAMHYIGMAAMRMPLRIIYNVPLVATSILLAVVISIAALILSFRVRDENRATPRKVVTALIMGSAIPVMHYTGMWAASFAPSDAPIGVSHAVSITSLGLVVIIVSTLLILSLVIATAFLDRLLSAQKALTYEARTAEEYFRTIAEAIPAILWTARADGYRDYWNQRWQDYTGISHEQGLDDGWQSAIHADDVSAAVAAWRHSVESGAPYNAEYRLRRADGVYRWHLVRALPLRGQDGKIARWFGAATDIDDHKRNQQTLEQEVRKRTEELVQSNGKLTQEMSERARTQEELNRQTASLVDELLQRSERGMLLARMGELLHSCDLEEEAFSIVLGFAPKLFPGMGGAVILLKASKKLLEVVGSWDPCQLPNTVFEPSSCWALRTGHRYLVEAGERMAPCAHAKGVTGAYLCIPIQAHGDALGLIHFQASNQATKFTEQEQLLSTTFAEQVGLSIANIRLREALRNQSIRDSVTGLFNRRYLEETLEREVHRAIRTGQTLGVIMLDLDHFKNFNDTFGHDAGDTVLRNTGEFLSKNIRADDIACRYGGGRVCINSAERQPGGYGVTGEKTEGFCESTKYQAPGQTFGDGYRVSGGRDISSARFHTDPADGRSRCRALPSKEDRPRQGGNCRTQLF